MDLVGEPPMTCLTRWRMTLAADLLVGSEAVTVAEVARAVGCSDAFGFSAASKRTRGVSPSGYRHTTTVASPSPTDPPTARRDRLTPRPNG